MTIIKLSNSGGELGRLTLPGRIAGRPGEIAKAAIHLIQGTGMNLRAGDTITIEETASEA